MIRRFSVLAFFCLALMALTTAPATAAKAKNPPAGRISTKLINPDDPREPALNLCGSVCSSGTPCDSCRTAGGLTTTCGQFAGHPANDLDGDGVVDTNDNCSCAANSNQANCDGDAYGDVCDFQDNSWKLITTGTQHCYLDTDNHTFNTTLEFYYQNVYKSSCTGQTCYQKYLRGSVSCTTGSDYYQCCQNKWFAPDCGGAWNQDQCGLPRCAF